MRRDVHLGYRCGGGRRVDSALGGRCCEHGAPTVPGENLTAMTTPDGMSCWSCWWSPPTSRDRRRNSAAKEGCALLPGEHRGSLVGGVGDHAVALGPGGPFRTPFSRPPQTATSIHIAVRGAFQTATSIHVAVSATEVMGSWWRGRWCTGRGRCRNTSRRSRPGSPGTPWCHRRCSTLRAAIGAGSTDSCCAGITLRANLVPGNDPTEAPPLERGPSKILTALGGSTQPLVHAGHPR